MVSSILVLFWLVAVPFGFLLYGSLRSDSPLAPQSTFTFSNWLKAYTDPHFLKALWVTIEIAGYVIVLAVPVGIVLAWIIARTDTPMRGILEPLIISPLLIPPLVGAMAWQALGAPNSGLLNIIVGTPLINIFSKSGVIWVMFLFLVPYAYLFTAGPLRSMDPAMEEASRISGGGTFVTLRRISLPLLAPAIMSASLMVFILSAEMFSIPGLLGRPANYVNIPYLIYATTEVTPPQWPVAAAAGTLLLWISIPGVILYRYISRLSERYVTITGRGYVPKPIRLGKWKYVMLGIVGSYIITAVLLPYSMLILASFMKYTTPNISRDTFTLSNYNILADPWIFESLLNTMLVVSVTPALIIGLAAVLSYFSVRTRLPGRGIVDNLATIPVAIPGIVLAVALLWTYFRIKLPIYGSILIIIIAYVTRYLPYGHRTFGSSYLQIHKELEEASRVAGASMGRTLLRITIPLLKPSLIYVWILLFIIIFREVGAAIILGGPNSMVLSVLLWDFITAGKPNIAYALGIVQSIVILGVILLVRKILRMDITKGFVR